MRAALKQGYVVRIVYICINDPELSIRRVPERVAHGGHDVPDDDVRRRYARSLANVPEVLGIANQRFVFDNSRSEPRKMLETDAGAIIWQATDQPAWVLSLIENLA